MLTESLFSFLASKTPEQIAAFNRYVKWMVDHFRNRIHYWRCGTSRTLIIGTLSPVRRLWKALKSFVQVVRQSDDSAKVIYGGQAEPFRDFTKRALDRCECASGIDVYAYHTYPGYGQNLNPEAMDYGAYLTESPRLLRELVRNYPGVRSDIQFFDDDSTRFHLGKDRTNRFKSNTFHAAWCTTWRQGSKRSCGS